MKFRVILAWAFLVSTAAPARAYIGGSYPGDLIPGATEVEIGGGNTRCSATKVAKKYLVLSAHCDFFGDLKPGYRVWLYNHKHERTLKPGAGIEGPDRIVRVWIHPSWKRNDINTDRIFTDAVDLAVLELDDASFIESEARISTRTLGVGERVIVGGFGCKGRGFWRPYLTVGIKSVLELSPLTFTVGVRDATPADAMSFGCEGDSGGGAFRADPKTGELELVGVNAAVSLGEAGFKVDPASGKLLSWTSSSKEKKDPEFYIVRVANQESGTALDALGWLRTILPASAFKE